MYVLPSESKINYLSKQMHSGKIEKVDNCIFFGLIINRNFKWNSHVNYITSKITRYIGLFMILGHALPADTQLKLCLAAATHNVKCFFLQISMFKHAIHSQ